MNYIKFAANNNPRFAKKNMTISSMIQPDKRNIFFQIIEFSVYRFYSLLKEGKGDIGDGKQCFKLKGRGVNLYSKKDFIEYNDLDEIIFDDICLELYSLSNRTPKWDMDRLFAYKSEIVDNYSNILEAKSVNDVTLFVSDTKTANFIFALMMNLQESDHEDQKDENSEIVDVKQESKTSMDEPIKLLQVEFLQRFQILEQRINDLETENKRLDSKEKEDQEKIMILESSLKKIEKLEEQIEILQKSRKKELTEVLDALEEKLKAVSDQISEVNESSFNKESVREFFSRLDQVERNIIDIKDEYVKDDALQSFSKQLEKLNKEISFLTDDHGNELKKIDLRFTKIKGERLELRDKMNLIEENISEKIDQLNSKFDNEVVQVNTVSDEMTRRQQELQTMLRDEISTNKSYIDKLTDKINNSFSEVKEKQHELFITVNEIKGKKGESSSVTSSVSKQPVITTSEEDEITNSNYIEICYAEPDGNGFLTNLSSKKLTYKHVYKVKVIDETSADFEFVDEEDAKKTLNMNLAMMFDEYMSDNGTSGPKISLSSYGEAKKVRGLNAWRVHRKAIVNRS
ncbi:hypothetical protein [Flammeovirga sp. EKP202]|uniref:hypothetical protein n=1 Tax=Flammeovirga sp. EKP202 TaxID=2770592 RepID=UPI00165F8502|nr:hypothetical protein [Flammeovirga sp. EKP202]MBD0401279.1 hypothetical protein [Flammeovirga sp. EKP202]